MFAARIDTMKIVVHLLHREQAVRDCLCRHGWKLESGSDNLLTATHPDVKSAFDARQSLLHSGLLTSPALRIEFPPVVLHLHSAVG
jgi:hypothetical protein